MGQIVKSLVFVAGTTPLLVATSGDNQVDTEALQRLLGHPVRSASPEEVRQFTGFAIGGVAWTLVILPLVLLAHAPSGANWVFSTVILQKRAPDNFRGRVFSTEWLLLTFADTAAILAASFLLQSGRFDLRSCVLFFGALQVVCGAFWMVTVVPAERRDRESNMLGER